MLNKFIKTKMRFLLILPVLAITAVPVFGYLIIVQGATPIGEELQNKVWQTLLDKGTNDARNMSASFKYTDSGKYEFKPSNFQDMFPSEDPAQMDEQYSFTISKLNFGMQSGGYFDFTNKDFPKTDSHTEGWLNNNRKKYSASVDMKLKDNEAFVKYDYSKDLSSLISNAGLGEIDSNKNMWMQITDAYQLDNLRESLASINKPEQLPQFEQLLRENRLFDIKKLKGIHKINSATTLQYELELNKSKLRNLVSASIAMNGGYNQADDDFAKQILFALIDKIQIKDFNVWIGVTDGKLYKSTMNSNALSVSKTLAQFEKIVKDQNGPLKESLEQARARSRDAKRMADIRQMASALELYYNDNNQYPPAQNGKPVGISPTYISVVPTEPMPADGSCTDYDNIYWYYRPTPNTYRYLFCLGQNTGGVSKGVAEINQNGFLNPVPYEDPYNNSSDLKLRTAFLETIKQMSFDAKVQMTYSAKEIGVTKEILPPKQYIKAVMNMYSDLKAAITSDSSLFKFK